MSNESEDLKPMDTRILELLAKTRQAKVGGMWMKPTGLARNMSATREYINKRLIELETRGYVETDGNGFYRITQEGVEFITVIDG